jgi:hypothetical protein
VFKNEQKKKQPNSIHQKKYVNFQIKITDSGKGMSKDQLSKVFVNLKKSEKPDLESKLPLSISKQIIEQLGGSVRIQSIQGKGNMVSIAMKTKFVHQKTLFREESISDDQSISVGSDFNANSQSNNQFFMQSSFSNNYFDWITLDQNRELKLMFQMRNANNILSQVDNDF